MPINYSRLNTKWPGRQTQIGCLVIANELMINAIITLETNAINIYTLASLVVE